MDLSFERQQWNREYGLKNVSACCEMDRLLSAGESRRQAPRPAGRPAVPVTAVLEALRLRVTATATYAARLTREPVDVRAAQALRFTVFNLELNEGLPESYATGVDADLFDEVCDHLVVEHLPSACIVGTYRLQSGATAAAQLGYYSAQEFDLGPFEPMRTQIVELGRACVHRLHRNTTVLGLLWKGIGDYARARGARYLCGCSSLTSDDPSVGAAVHARLAREHLAGPEWRAQPRVGWECPMDRVHPNPPAIPRLLRAYLNLGAKICGPPAIDRAFWTVDFLTWLDIQALPATVLQRYGLGDAL
jgi:putative hemolysin